MPAFRNVRRSRRLSRQPPRNPGNDEFDLYDLELVYPDDVASSPAVTTPDVHLPPPDDTGEPEIDPESLLPSPATNPATFSNQRTSHSRKKKPGHIPRPPNAFMIFRSELWNKEKIKSTVERDHRQISRIAGNLWNDLTDAERAPYQRRAEEAKIQHARMYPQYKYSPIYRRDKPAKRKPKQDHHDKILRCHEVARLIQEGYEGDELKRELDRREARSMSDGRLSDEDEYVDSSRRRRTPRLSTKKSSLRPRPRRERPVKGQDEDDEYIPPHRDNVSLRDASVKESDSPASSRSSVRLSVEPEAFVPTSDIPPLDLGESCLREEVECSNPFASEPRSPHTFIGGSLSPDSSSLSEDFLAPTAEESKLRSSSPTDQFSALFASVSDGPSFGSCDADIFSPTLPVDGAYYAPDYFPGTLSSELDFSEWMHYDE